MFLSDREKDTEMWNQWYVIGTQTSHTTNNNKHSAHELQFQWLDERWCTTMCSVVFAICTMIIIVSFEAIAWPFFFSQANITKCLVFSIRIYASPSSRFVVAATLHRNKEEPKMNCIVKTNCIHLRCEWSRKKQQQNNEIIVLLQYWSYFIHHQIIVHFVLQPHNITLIGECPGIIIQTVGVCCSLVMFHEQTRETDSSAFTTANLQNVIQTDWNIQ